MDALRSFMLGIAALIISIVTSVAVMMKGWGLEPKSWGWIIGVYLIGNIISLLFMAAAKSD